MIVPPMNATIKRNFALGACLMLRAENGNRPSSSAVGNLMERYAGNVGQRMPTLHTILRAGVPTAPQLILA
jgi:hypothetical protein